MYVLHVYVPTLNPFIGKCISYIYVYFPITRFKVGNIFNENARKIFLFDGVQKLYNSLLAFLLCTFVWTAWLSLVI